MPARTRLAGGAAAAVAALCAGPVAVAAMATVATSPIEMVVTANNLATDAGRKALAAGGSAVDAMVAAQVVLSLVEPQSSGIGGGAFVVYHDAEGGKGLTTFDARETAPATATEDRYVGADGEVLAFSDAWQSALAVGTPGVPRLMEDLHMKYGKLPWASLFEDAQRLARDGYALTGRTESNANELLAENKECNELFFRDPVAFDYFIDNATCTAKPKGTIVTNAEYADTLDLLAEGGADAFYSGPIAHDILAKVAADRKPTDDPIITAQDMLDYKVIEREPVCKEYRGKYNVCGMGPPSSGALAVGQILGILESFDLTSGNDDPQSLNTVHLFTQAMRLAFADRNQYVGDADFVTVPVEGMLDSEYLASRAALINRTMDLGAAEPGIPPGTLDPASPQEVTYEGGTSHVSIVDAFGNALSMTTTVESFFGSGLMVRGFLLNNQLTDFSFEARDESGTPIANRVQPGKRARSSMSPTIVYDMDGDVEYLAGSPGGSRIIGYTSQALVSMLDFGRDPQEAVNTPHYQNRNGPTELEPPMANVTSDYDFEALSDGLISYGHTVEERGGETSGLSVIQVTKLGFLGGADPRRDGTAGGRAAKGCAK